jgi:NifU-like protein involved in Fe-S cluster formation
LVDDPYTDVVRAAFANPVHAGDLAGQYRRILRSAASASDTGPRLELSAGIDDGKIAEIRFRAWGCPHLIAAAEWACERLEGRSADPMETISANDLAAALSVPVTKTGVMLLLEDAIAALGEDQDANDKD